LQRCRNQPQDQRPLRSKNTNTKLEKLDNGESSQRRQNNKCKLSCGPKNQTQQAKTYNVTIKTITQRGVREHQEEDQTPTSDGETLAPPTTTTNVSSAPKNLTLHAATVNCTRASGECLAPPTTAINVTRDSNNQTKNRNAKNCDCAIQQGRRENK